MARRRLDAELVRRHLARSRDHARELIDAGSVRVRGTVATKAATQVEEADPIVVAEGQAADGYVSRGAHKLIGALDRLPPRDRGGARLPRCRRVHGGLHPGAAGARARRGCWRSTSGTGSSPGRCGPIRG